MTALHAEVTALFTEVEDARTARKARKLDYILHFDTNLDDGHIYKKHDMIMKSLLSMLYRKVAGQNEESFTSQVVDKFGSHDGSRVMDKFYKSNRLNRIDEFSRSYKLNRNYVLNRSSRLNRSYEFNIVSEFNWTAVLNSCKTLLDTLAKGHSYIMHHLGNFYDLIYLVLNKALLFGENRIDSHMAVDIDGHIGGSIDSHIDGYIDGRKLNKDKRLYPTSKEVKIGWKILVEQIGKPYYQIKRCIRPGGKSMRVIVNLGN
jgi:hypothetical protein